MSDETCSEELLNGPLVRWATTFLGEDGGPPLTYDILLDGLFLQDVMLQIHPSLLHRGLTRNPGDKTTRLRNLAIVLKNIKHFFEDVLDQILVTRLPDVALLAGDPGRAVLEMRQLLLLLLGCAVQCHCRQQVIDRITAMDHHAQHTIVQCIQQVTENPETVITAEWRDSVSGDGCSEAVHLLLQLVRRLAHERDSLSMRLVELLLQDHALDRSCSGGLYSSITSPSSSDLEENGSSDTAGLSISSCSLPNSPNRHLHVELADCKARLRKVKQELDEKTEQLLEARDELEMNKSSLSKLRSESLQLMQDARAAKAYRDELDVAQERASRVDNLEMELQRYRDRLNDVEFFKNRADELREDNRILIETKEMLEDQLQTARKRSEQVVQLETSIIRYKQQLRDLNVEREVERGRIQDLLEENAQLQINSKNTLNESASLVAELDSLRSHQKEGSSGHSSLSDQLNSDAHGRVLRLELENQRLLTSVETLKESSQKMERLVAARDEQLSRSDQLELENRQLQQRIDSLVQQRGEDDEDKDSEREKSFSQQLSQLSERLSESAGRIQRLEQLKAAGEREADQLREALRQARASCSQHELHVQQHSQLQQEYCQLSELVKNMKEQLGQVDVVRRENCELHSSLSEVRQQHASSHQLHSTLQLQHEQLQASLHLLKQQLLQAELKLSNQQTDKQQLAKTAETCQRRVDQLEREVNELETENQKLVRNNETLKVSCRRLNEIERENTELEAARDVLAREKQSASRETSRLRLALETREALVDELSGRVEEAERGNRQLLKDKQAWEAENNRLRKLDEENTNLMQESKLDRKTLLTLREQLVQEKVKSQELSDELERLNEELRKIGIDQQRLETSDFREGESRFKALEAMMEEALKKNTDLKDQKIANLESKIRQANEKYQAVRSELMSVRRELEQVQQENGAAIGDAGLQKELVTVQSRLTELERRNNLLLCERDTLVCERDTLHDQVDTLRSAVNQAHGQCSQTARHSAEMQARLATVQVENTALQSRADSLSAQMAAVKAQVSTCAAEKDQLIRHREELRASQEQLISDHETLQQLHEQLTAEYEGLQQQQAQLKTANKTAKHDLKTLQERYTAVSEGQDDLVRIKESLEEERLNLKSDSQLLHNLKDEHSRLKDDFRNLFSTNEKLKVDYKNLQSDYKAVKNENNSLKLKQTAINGQISNSRDQINSLEVEVSKLNNKCEMLSQLNTALEEDRRSLMGQVTVLLSQYHDLLSTTLVEKDQYREEEKQLADKLNELRRQKEKLEEKIMEQYRRMDNYTPKNRRGFGANLVRRVKRAGNDLISRVPRSRSRGRLEPGTGATTDSQDSTSLGSAGSTTNESVEEGGHRSASVDSLNQCSTGSHLSRRQRRTDGERRASRVADVSSSPLSATIDCELGSTPALPAWRRPASVLLLAADSDTGSPGRYRSCVSVDQTTTHGDFTPIRAGRSNYTGRHCQENGLSRGLVTARPKNLKFFCGEDTMSNDGSLRLSSVENGRVSLPGGHSANTSTCTDIQTADIVSLRGCSDQPLSSTSGSTGIYQSLVSVSSGCQAAASSSGSTSGSVCSLTANTPDHTTTIAIHCGDEAPPTNHQTPPTIHQTPPIIDQAPPIANITINGQSPPSPRRLTTEGSPPPSLPPRASEPRTPPLPARALSLRRSGRNPIAVDVLDSTPSPLLHRRPSVPPRQAPPPPAVSPSLGSQQELGLKKEMAAAKSSVWYEYGCV